MSNARRAALAFLAGTPSALALALAPGCSHIAPIARCTANRTEWAGLLPELAQALASADYAALVAPVIKRAGWPLVECALEELRAMPAAGPEGQLRAQRAGTLLELRRAQ